MPWTFFAYGLAQSANSLVSSENLIKKVYFPRLVIPISGVLGGLPDFALSFLVLLGMMIFYGRFPTLASIIWLPLLLLLALITSLGDVGGTANATHLGGLLVAWLYLKSGRVHPWSEVKYRYLKWKINRVRRKFDVYSGGRANDWDRRVH